MRSAIEGFRLSPTQRRLWSVQAADGGDPYTAWTAVEIDGPMEPGRLEAAVRATSRRHEILRTAFLCPEPATVPVQVIRDEAALRWEVVPEGSPEAPPPGRLPLRLDEGPLISVRLVVLGPERHRLELRLPSLLADAGTLHRWVAAIRRQYRDGEEGGPPPDEPPLQYADLSEWLNGLLEDEDPDEEEGRRHWRSLDLPRRLAAAGALGEERTPEAPLPFTPRTVDRPIDPETAARLRELAESRGVPLERVLLASFLVLLERSVTGGGAITAVARAGRGYEELEAAFGPFARFLPLACAPREGETVPDILDRLGSELEAMEEWLELFTWEGRALGEDGLARPPFGFELLPPGEPGGEGEPSFAVADLDVTLEPFTLRLACRREPDGTIRARFVHDAARLEHAAAGRMAERFVTLTAGLAAAPGTPWERLPLVGDAERRALLETERSAPTAPAPERLLFERVAEQARRTPDRVALVDELRTLSYGGLRSRSRTLAGRLARLGAGPESRVAICLERSADVVVAMLAAHEAGAAYVPLDPTFPRERLETLLHDAGATVLVSAPEVVRKRFGGSPGVESVVTMGEAEASGEGEGRSTDPPAAGRASPDGLAYVIYTSGSTGAAKGIAVEHRQLAHYVQGASERLDLPGEGVYALVSTFAADLGNTLIFPALCSGATLRIVSERRVTDPIAWLELLDRRPVDVLKIVPSHLRLLLEGPRPADALPRRRLVLGGEACDWRLVDRVFELAPECRVFNHYGPTETTVGVLAGELSRDRPRLVAPPLGEPLPNNRVRLLDRSLEPVPLGMPGELCVSGANLARGYLDRPARTAERFVPDPRSERPGGRLYRTGDRVRRHPDGLLFIGRVDDQVKIHGVRIEPGEVESVLAQVPGVERAAVVPRLDPPDRHRLVAYVVPEPGRRAGSAEGGDPDLRLSAGALRRRLLEKLPEPLVPADFVLLDELPLTANGKVDREALPAPDEVPAPAGARRPPKNPLELQLLQIWEEVLGRRSIGVTDDFFEIGGDSFLAVRLMARIGSHFDRRLPLTTLISDGTVRRLAGLLSAGEAGEARHLVAVQPLGTKPSLFCVHPGHGSVICYLELAHHLGRDQPLFGFQALDFDLDRDPHVSLEAMASRYVDELEAAHPEGPYRLAGWSFGGLIAYEMARQLHARGREVEVLILFDCRLPMTAPVLTGLEPSLMRATLLFDHVTDRPEDGEVSPHDLAGLSLDEQLDAVSKRLGARPEDLVPEELGPELLHRYVEARMARIDALRSYRFRPYPGRVVLFRASEPTPRVPLEEMRRAFDEAARSADYGWGRLSPRVEVVEVPGTHGSMIDTPHVEELSRRLTEILGALEPAREAV